MGNFQQGFYPVKNVEKYIGDPKKVIFRSSWEFKLFRHCDLNPNVIKWGSEEFCIPYFNPLDQKVHRYFPDVFVVVKNKNGTQSKKVIEVKPFNETIPPIPSHTRKQGKLSKRYLTESATYTINEAKWEAARTFCKKNGLEFIIMTEYELGIKDRPQDRP